MAQRRIFWFAFWFTAARSILFWGVIAVGEIFKVSASSIPFFEMMLIPARWLGGSLLPLYKIIGMRPFLSIVELLCMVITFLFVWVALQTLAFLSHILSHEREPAP